MSEAQVKIALDSGPTGVVVSAVEDPSQKVLAQTTYEWSFLESLQVKVSEEVERRLDSKRMNQMAAAIRFLRRQEEHEHKLTKVKGRHDKFNVYAVNKASKGKEKIGQVVLEGGTWKIRGEYSDGDMYVFQDQDVAGYELFRRYCFPNLLPSVED